MTREEKQLLLKDLCGRLTYGVKFALSGGNIYTMKGIDLIVTDEGNWEYAVTAKGIEPIEIEYIKPYLRPMSSMTEEERKEVETLIKDNRPNPYGEINNKGMDNLLLSVSVTSNVLIDYLNSHYFDYRGLIKKRSRS
jgi:hypothetical protein